MSEASERIKAYSCIAPLQLGMAICNLYENAYFPVLYADNQLLCSRSAARSGRIFFLDALST